MSQFRRRATISATPSPARWLFRGDRQRGVEALAFTVAFSFTAALVLGVF